jgi:lipopolysaccharide/colanic/teichoic acid biosynthesis glycosyltransferase
MQVNGSYYFDVVNGYHARHRMKPGLTGWAQVNGSRGEVDTLEKAHNRVALDLWYITNWSPLLDIQIVLRTAFGGFVTLRAD